MNDILGLFAAFLACMILATVIAAVAHVGFGLRIM
jgi:hypothetical protein